MNIDFQLLDNRMQAKCKRSLIALAMKEYSPTYHQFVYNLHVEKKMSGAEIHEYITKKAGRKITSQQMIRTILVKMGVWQLHPKAGNKKPLKYRKCHAEGCNAAVPPANYWLCDKCKGRSNNILNEHSVSVGGAGFF